MNIYTSYWNCANKLSADDFVFIGVSTSTPKYWDKNKSIITLPELFPGWNLVNGIKTGEIDEDEYSYQYLLKISKLDKETVLNKIRKANPQNKDVLLLCYETPDKFCHRHLIAQWLDPKIQEYEQIKTNKKNIQSFQETER